jgi:hypothetical protein
MQFGTAAATRSVERRLKRRFRIERRVRYRSQYGNSFREGGSGVAVDASSRGVLLEAENQLKVGDVLELLIDWPAQLNGAIPLRLVTVGSVVRVQGRRCAVSVERYEFRTRWDNAARAL